MTDDLAFNGYDDAQPGLGAPYPRMLYRAGTAETLHGFEVDTMIVHSETEEDERTQDGWALTPTRAYKPATPPKPDPRDAEIAELRAQLVAQATSTVTGAAPDNSNSQVEQRRGPGRPPKIAPEA